MRKPTIAGHVAIVCLASFVGWVGGVGYGISCTYAKQPFGSECRFAEWLKLFLPGMLLASVVLYAIWGLGFVAVRLFKGRSRN
jgi:hypothetical protein